MDPEDAVRKRRWGIRFFLNPLLFLFLTPIPLNRQPSYNVHMNLFVHFCFCKMLIFLLCIFLTYTNDITLYLCFFLPSTMFQRSTHAPEGTSICCFPLSHNMPWYVATTSYPSTPPRTTPRHSPSPVLFCDIHPYHAPPEPVGGRLLYTSVNSFNAVILFAALIYSSK